MRVTEVRRCEYDAGTFENLLEAETDRLFGLAFAILGSRTGAEDAVQSTFEAAWRRRSRLREIKSPSAWLTTVCVRRCIDLRRRAESRQRALRRLPTNEISELSPDVSLDLKRAYERLPLTQRAVLALHIGAGYTLDETAVIVGKRPGTVRSHYARALRRLREDLCDGK
jgi:RNA polymerase sigma-70 factor (ECF subfamily)